MTTPLPEGGGRGRNPSTAVCGSLELDTFDLHEVECKSLSVLGDLFLSRRADDGERSAVVKTSELKAGCGRLAEVAGLPGVLFRQLRDGSHGALAGDAELHALRRSGNHDLQIDDRFAGGRIHVRLHQRRMAGAGTVIRIIAERAVVDL